MPQIKKILFPVDFSEACRGAARYVEAFACEFGAEITLLHTVGMQEHVLPEELLPIRKAQLELFLADELNHFATNRICTISDDPACAIVTLARSLEPDLLMMPTHGLGFFRRHLLGSVTAKALHDLECPVWTTVHAETAPALEQIHCRRILCSIGLHETELGESSERVLEWAGWLARQYAASLGIVHATAVIEGAVASWSLEEEFNRQVSAEAKRQIGELQAHAGTAAQVFVRTGKPEAVVADTARAFDADLLVIGRHSGSERHLFHSAYAILRESPCPVVSV
jgi:nucleotide-binding universal stress UspA family protein